MSVIDRTFQRALLIAMRDAYPMQIHDLPTPADATEQTVYANLLYLEEHGLCESGLSPTMMSFTFVGCRITAAGLDFLEEDGGLSAILGVVTVKLHADTVRDLIAAKIDAAPIPAEEKSALKKRIAGLSEAGLRAVASDLVKLGLDHLPDAIHWLRASVGL